MTYYFERKLAEWLCFVYVLNKARIFGQHGHIRVRGDVANQRIFRRQFVRTYGW